MKFSRIFKLSNTRNFKFSNVQSFNFSNVGNLTLEFSSFEIFVFPSSHIFKYDFQSSNFSNCRTFQLSKIPSIYISKITLGISNSPSVLLQISLRTKFTTRIFSKERNEKIAELMRRQETIQIFISRRGAVKGRVRRRKSSRAVRRDRFDSLSLLRSFFLP